MHPLLWLCPHSVRNLVSISAGHLILNYTWYIGNHTRQWKITNDLREWFPSLTTFLAAFLASSKWAFKRGTGGNFSVSSNSKINLTAWSCFPLLTSFWMRSAEHQKIKSFEFYFRLPKSRHQNSPYDSLHPRQWSSCESNIVKLWKA